jgi:glycosyltransferase involved in cell wall biosynthesis
MPHGEFPQEYITNPNIDKPIGEIYRDINGFTWELFKGEERTPKEVDFTVVLPPIWYRGRFLKGLFFSRGVDYLIEAFPGLQSMFTSMAYSMFCAYPWAEHADAYLACYRNPAREQWYRDTYPRRAQTHFIPLADTDYLDEYRFGPVPHVARDIDVLCVSRLQNVKNVQVIAQALKVYGAKYGRPIRMTLITGHRRGVSPGDLPPYARDQLAALNRILGRFEDYIDLYGYVDHWEDLPRFYSRAGMYVLGSLIEGKNRGINEALSCDVPVLHFREFNQFARQGDSVLPENAGQSAAFDPESMADAMHLIRENAGAFSPRLAYLSRYGRRNFLNRCLDSIPYYRGALPGFIPGQHAQNPWIDAGLFDNYGKSLDSFLYRPGPGLARGWGLESISQMLSFFRAHIGHGK